MALKYRHDCRTDGKRAVLARSSGLNSSWGLVRLRNAILKQGRRHTTLQGMSIG